MNVAFSLLKNPSDAYLLFFISLSTFDQLIYALITVFVVTCESEYECVEGEGSLLVEDPGVRHVHRPEDVAHLSSVRSEMHKYPIITFTHNSQGGGGGSIWPASSTSLNIPYFLP